MKLSQNRIKSKNNKRVSARTQSALEPILSAQDREKDFVDTHLNISIRIIRKVCLAKVKHSMHKRIFYKKIKFIENSKKI